MVAVVFSNEDGWQPGNDDFWPRQPDDSHQFFQTLSVAPIRQRIQNILRSCIFPAEKPDFVDPQFRASLPCFNFAHIGHRRTVFAPVIISAASPARAKNHTNRFVQIVDGPRQIRRHPAFIIRMRHHHQNVHLVPLIRPFHRLRLLRNRARCSDYENQQKQDSSDSIHSGSLSIIIPDSCRFFPPESVPAWHRLDRAAGGR